MIRDLAAALMEADQMDQAGGQSDSDDGNSDVDDEDDDDEDDDDDDAGGRGEDGEDEETREKKDKVKQLNSEIKALEAAIEKKKSGFSGGNPIMMVGLTLGYRNHHPMLMDRNGSRRS
jgi:transcription initiation factor TFIID subunit 7